MDANEANMWLDLVLMVVRKHYKKLRSQQCNKRHGLYAGVAMAMDHKPKYDSDDDVIIIHCDKGDEHIRLYSGEEGIHYDMGIKGSLYDPSFDPASTIKWLEEMIIYLKGL
jgi:hypothetical protein